MCVWLHVRLAPITYSICSFVHHVISHLLAKMRCLERRGVHVYFLPLSISMSKEE
jgi:hypothetical protein